MLRVLTGAIPVLVQIKLTWKLSEECITLKSQHRHDLTRRKIRAPPMIDFLYAGLSSAGFELQVRQIVSAIQPELQYIWRYWGIPTLSNQSSCSKIFATIMTGAAHPSGSYSLAINDRIERLVRIVVGAGEAITKTSSRDSNDNPRTFNVSSFERTWFVSSCWLWGISSESIGEFAAHFRNWNPPPFFKSMSSSRVSR